MPKGQGIIYLTGNAARVGYLPDGQTKGPVAEERMELQHSQEDCRRFASFLRARKFFPERLVLCIPRSLASVRFLSLPTQDDAEIQRMAGYEMEALFPYKPGEFVHGCSVTEKQPGGYARLMLVAVQRQVLREHLDFVRWTGLHPDEIWISAQALARAFTRTHPAGNDCLVYIDDGYAELLFFSKGRLELTRAVSLADDRPYEAAIMRETLACNGIAVDNLIAAGSHGEPQAAEYLAALSRQLGCPVLADDSLSVLQGLSAGDPADAPVNLLPYELKADKIIRTRRKSIAVLCAVAALNIIIGLNLVFLRGMEKREYLARLSARIQAMDVQTVALQKKLSTLRAYEHFAGSGKRKLKMLAGLAAACPGDVLLHSLEIAGESQKETVVASGKARDADTVLRFASALKEGTAVARADVSYISKRSDPGGWVDFEIKAGY